MSTPEPNFDSNGSMRIAILGNSGSGKSTLAGQLADRYACQALDLDTIAWESGEVAVARDPELARDDVRAFCRATGPWIVEGCYGELIEASLASLPTLLFMDPGLDACLANCRGRPWEPHKFRSKAEQDEHLEYLLGWVAGYYSRAEGPSQAAHDALFRGYDGPKQRLVTRPPQDFEPPACAGPPTAH